ncbi:serine hydrolase [Streptomyces sp. NPDC059909]|uniref:serine hydrolase n=1 Tax=Streptomyces sp. NPDC059909 TaxID=3346998 RepID=UPI00365369A2
MSEDTAEQHGSRAPHRDRPTFRLTWAVTAAVVLLGGAVVATSHAGNGWGRKAGAAASSSSPPSPSAPGSASASPPVENVVAETETVDLDAALASVVAEADGGLSVAVRDARSGASAIYGEETFDTASIVKVDILAALLLQAQDEGRGLTARERSLASTMIENSDNAAALALWRSIGRTDGLEAANERFGMTGTEGGTGDLWGLTQTTAADQLSVLDAVFGDESPLTEDSRAYVTDLMEHISAGQDWGVSAAASTGSQGVETALKNGWLPRTATGLWDINSIGRIASGGRTYHVAVLSDGNRTKESGIRTVEDAARTAVAALRATM